MNISVVICTHNQENYPNLAEAVASLLAQTRKASEIIIAVDGNSALYEKVRADYNGKIAVRSVLIENNQGVSFARNAGISLATGDVVAFMDDDAFADKSWIENLESTYATHNAFSVGGKILPVWVGGMPPFLPEELYWLIGATGEGFAGDTVIEVRNTFGPNMSFKKEVFEKIGGFNKNFGFTGGNLGNFQAEEAEFGLRMCRAFGKGVLYNPQAVVYHKVPPDKLKMMALVKRAFFQGYSKALLRRLDIVSGSMAQEKDYLKHIAFVSFPRRLKRTEFKKAYVLLVVTLCVGFGYAYAHFKNGSRSASGNR